MNCFFDPYVHNRLTPRLRRLETKAMRLVIISDEFREKNRKLLVLKETIHQNGNFNKYIG